MTFRDNHEPYSTKLAEHKLEEVHIRNSESWPENREDEARGKIY